MMLKKTAGIGALYFFILAMLPIAIQAQDSIYEDFEDGIDHQPVVTSIEGLEFVNDYASLWIYGDWRTGSWNGPYPDGSYYSEGNFFAILDGSVDSGKIIFTETTADWVQVGYSSYESFTMDAYDSDDNLLDSAMGNPNLNTGQLDYIRIDAEEITYVILTGPSNYWMIDNFEADAIDWECEFNMDCDDGVFCNGLEYCADHECQAPYSVACPSDGLYCNGIETCDEAGNKCLSTDVPKCEDDQQFCNGVEFCKEETDGCDRSGNPCENNEICNEENDSCEIELPQDDDEEADDDEAAGDEDDNSKNDDKCGS